MAKKKSKSTKKGTPFRSGSESTPESRQEADLPTVFGPRGLEGVLQQHSRGWFDDASQNQTPLEQAQGIMYEAFEAEGEAERIALAKKALEVSKDCADAYVLLAEETPALDESVKLYEEGVAAGERALGRKGFRQSVGDFWGVLETRPYMRAREGLARCLWEAGHHEKAIEHYQEMLRLNPNDNQGIRYLLASALFSLDRDKELAELLERYVDDVSTDWQYARALLAFRQEGDSPRARKLLKAAKKVNKYVPEYLTGDKPIPRALPDIVGVGDELEAIAYSAEYLKAWRNTSGAISWLRTTLKVRLASPPKPRRPSWTRVKTQLLRLPQEPGEVWQVDLRPLMGEDGKADLWRLLITNPTDDTVVLSDYGPGKLPTQDVWEVVVESMLHPQDDEPHRPERIEVQQERLAKAWRSKLAQVEIECQFVEELAHLDRVASETTPPAEFMQRLLNRDLAADESDLPEVPQEAGEVWQAGVRRLPTWIQTENGPQRPWTALVVDAETDRVLATDLRTGEYEADWLWQNVHHAIRQPAIGEPHRPETIQVQSEEHRAALGAHLEAAGIECKVIGKLEPLDRIFAELSAHMSGSEAGRGMVDMPGVTVEQVGSFFEAAAAFYRSAPWRRVEGDAIILVECKSFQSGPWYAVVMGQSGMTVGLALYEDLEVLEQTLTGELSDEENGRRMSGMSVTFGEAFDLLSADLIAAEEHGWSVAGPEAYPSATRVNPGLAFRSPLNWELQLLEGCLRTIPEFVDGKEPASLRTVATGGGELPLKLSWFRS